MKIRLILGVLLFSLLPVCANSAEVGLDFLGIKSRHWNCDAMMAAVNTLPKPIPFGAFVDETFGTDDRCLRRLLSSGKVSKFRGHLRWSNHQPVPTSELIARAKIFDALAAAYPGISFYASPVCEHHLSTSQSIALNASLRPFMPNVEGLSDSGLRGKDPNAIAECHGNKVKCSIISEDGGDNGNGNGMLDVDVEQVKQNGSFISYLWDKSFNCRINKDTRKPHQRTDCPNQDQFCHFVRLWYPKPPEPHIAFADGGRSQPLTAKQIYKPSADNHGGCKGKDCRPVYITPTRQSRINITALDGRPLGWLRYFGTYQGGGHRYYLATGSGQTAFQLGQQAETVSGSEYVVVHDGRSRFVVNAYRRGGLMR